MSAAATPAATPVTISDCRWVLAEYQAGQGSEREVRDALGEAFLQRFLVETRLAKRWDWLDAHPDHEKHEMRESDCITTLAEYVEWSDVIRDLCRAVGRACQ